MILSLHCAVDTQLETALEIPSSDRVNIRIKLQLIESWFSSSKDAGIEIEVAKFRFSLEFEVIIAERLVSSSPGVTAVFDGEDARLSGGQAPNFLFQILISKKRKSLIENKVGN